MAVTGIRAMRTCFVRKYLKFSFEKSSRLSGLDHVACARTPQADAAGAPVMSRTCTLPSGGAWRRK